MELRSTAYRPGGAIPPQHACDGENQSPDFTWFDVPPQTKSLALVLHDPDAPKAGGFTHWVLYDIAPETRQIDAGVPKQDPVTDFGVQGKNDGGRIGYMGPCPPSGMHHYIARLYALDTEVDLKPGATRQELERVMEGHILDQAALMGTYARSVKTTRGRARTEVAA